VWRTDIVCSKHSPSCIEPCFGQRPENFGEVAAIKQTWDVLQECVTASHIANTLDRLRPLVPFVVLALFDFLLSCNAEWLAGKACRNHIDIALVFFSCTGLNEVVNVSKDGGFVEDAVFNPLREDFLAVGVVFDIAYRPPAQQLGPKQTTTGTRE
jgi:hypothetical protein